MKEEKIYRFLAVVIMFTAFFAQTFYTSFIVADYYTRTTSYAENCVNKNRPEMHCNGKCQMVKKIGSEEKKDQQSGERKDSKNDVVLSCEAASFLIPSFLMSKENVSSFFIIQKEIKRARTLLRPPIC